MKFLLSVVLMSVAFSMQAFAGPQCGDVDGDGRVDSADSSKIAAHNSRRINLTSAQRARADVNLDGKLDKADMELIQKKFANLANCLPCPADRDACKLKPPPSDPEMSLPGRLKTDPSKGRLPGFL
ncbi:MAG: hypothetical protein EBR09_17095 [Proteobacteria bacterium]|nr:hypothetical protein [Pseudomonadota bacterium]